MGLPKLTALRLALAHAWGRSALASRAKFREVPGQHRLQIGHRGKPPEGLPHVAQGYRNELKKISIGLDTVDIDKAAGILELALNGEEVEDLPELRSIDLGAARGRGHREVATHH